MKSFLPNLPPNVIRFPVAQRPSALAPTDSAAAYRALTHALVMDQHRRGVLATGIVEALLIGVGVEP